MYQFNPQSRKIPLAVEQLSPWVTATGLTLWSRLLKPEHPRARVPPKEKPPQ